MVLVSVKCPQMSPNFFIWKSGILTASETDPCRVFNEWEVDVPLSDSEVWLLEDFGLDNCPLRLDGVSQEVADVDCVLSVDIGVGAEVIAEVLDEMTAVGDNTLLAVAIV